METETIKKQEDKQSEKEMRTDKPERPQSPKARGDGCRKPEETAERVGEGGPGETGCRGGRK